jgi:hypothetical protein
MNNVVNIPFGDLSEIEELQCRDNRREAVNEFMVEVNDWCESHGIDIHTTEYRYQIAVVMTQLQVILMGAK